MCVCVCVCVCVYVCMCVRVRVRVHVHVCAQKWEGIQCTISSWALLGYLLHYDVQVGGAYIHGMLINTWPQSCVESKIILSHILITLLR